jgi:hypothetical protein
LLHRALASLLCVLGAAALGLGIASATLWRASDTLVAQAQAADGTTMIVTDPGMLDLAADEVTVRAEATSGKVVIALGRSADVDAWVDGDAHTRVTGLAAWDLLATEDVEAEPVEEPADADADADAAPEEPEAPADPATEADATADPAADATEGPAEAAAPDPGGSDLWVDEASGTRTATLEWSAQDGRWSVLVAATGTASPRLVLEWPQVVTTPWLMPGVVVGSLLLLIGIAWWVLILMAGRRAPHAAVVVAEEPRAVAEPALPMTRRQLRELEEQRARTRGRERETMTERFPMLVPGPRAQETHRGRHGDAVSDVQGRRSPGGTGRHGARPDPAVAAAPAPTPTPAPGPAATFTAMPGPVDAAAAAPVASRRSRRTGAASPPEPPAGSTPTAKAPRTSRGLLRRRGRSAAAVEVPDLTPQFEPAPDVEPQRTGTPSASADAWRRTWGLTSDVLPGARTEGTMPGGRPTSGGRGTEGDR